jgi:hypothetical protein
MMTGMITMSLIIMATPYATVATAGTGEGAAITADRGMAMQTLIAAMSMSTGTLIFPVMKSMLIETALSVRINSRP